MTGCGHEGHLFVFVSWNSSVFFRRRVVRAATVLLPEEVCQVQRVDLAGEAWVAQDSQGEVANLTLVRCLKIKNEGRPTW